MVDHISPQESGIELLQRLTHFSQEMESITELPSLAERILLEFCRATHQPEGSLYVRIQDSHQFQRLAIQGSAHGELLPSAIPLNHPLVEQLSLHQQTLSSTPHDTALVTQCRIRPSELDCSVNDMAIPLGYKNHLLAFITLRSKHNPDSLNLRQTESLLLMTRMAVHSLNSILLQELHRRANSLMRCTDRLHTLECMVDSLAHAVRNPLTSVKTFIQLASERRDDPNFLSNFSQMALDDVSRMERLTQETFDYVRYRKPNPTEEDLNDIVSSCLYFIEFTIKHRRIKIEKDLAPELPHGMVDRQHIQQTLFNLLFNAVEALEPHGGLLRVRTGRFTKPDGTAWAHIDVEDTGQGIAPENLERIFDHFFSTKNQVGEPTRSGLGLAIAKHIIDAHRGEIHVQSIEGAGTTLSIHLPLCTV